MFPSLALWLHTWGAQTRAGPALSGVRLVLERNQYQKVQLCH